MASSTRRDADQPPALAPLAAGLEQACPSPPVSPLSAQVSDQARPQPGEPALLPVDLKDVLILVANSRECLQRGVVA